MSLKKAKRGVDDLLYSLTSSLDQFRGPDGLHRFMTAGRLSLLSFIGEFDKSRDEMFDQRSQCVLSTRHYLLKLTEQFGSTVRAAEKLTTRIQEICETLETFHQHCDLELEFEDEEYPGVNMAFEESFREMKLLNQKIKSSFTDFSAAEATCKSLNDGAVTQLQYVDADVNKTVNAKQVEFDAARRRVQVKRTTFERAREMYGDRDSPELMLAEMNLQSAVSEMELSGSEYVECVRESMQSTTFALEQTSMSTWSSANVFFLQLSQFLEEVSLATRPLSSSFNNIKNAQKVSRRITQEKRFEAATAAANANANTTAARRISPPPLAVRGAQREPADGVVEHSVPSSPNKLDSLWQVPSSQAAPARTQAAGAVAPRVNAAVSNDDDFWGPPVAMTQAPVDPSRPQQSGPSTGPSPPYAGPPSALPATSQHRPNTQQPAARRNDMFNIDDLFS